MLWPILYVVVPYGYAPECRASAFTDYGLLVANYGKHLANSKRSTPLSESRARNLSSPVLVVWQQYGHSLLVYLVAVPPTSRRGLRPPRRRAQAVSVAHRGGRRLQTRLPSRRASFAGPGHSHNRMILAIYTRTTEGMQDSETTALEVTISRSGC
jgi:hypothetical protein